MNVSFALAPRIKEWVQWARAGGGSYPEDAETGLIHLALAVASEATNRDIAEKNESYLRRKLVDAEESLAAYKDQSKADNETILGIRELGDAEYARGWKEGRASAFDTPSTAHGGKHGL